MKPSVFLPIHCPRSLVCLDLIELLRRKMGESRERERERDSHVIKKTGSRCTARATRSHRLLAVSSNSLRAGFVLTCLFASSFLKFGESMETYYATRRALDTPLSNFRMERDSRSNERAREPCLASKAHDFQTDRSRCRVRQRPDERYSAPSIDSEPRRLSMLRCAFFSGFEHVIRISAWTRRKERRFFADSLMNSQSISRSKKILKLERLTFNDFDVLSQLRGSKSSNRDYSRNYSPL